jgi:nucleosome binding factor SPN SPT16 subunit
VATALAPRDWKDVAYYLKDGGEDEGEGDEGDAVVEVPEVGMRKSARTEHVDFKQREEERRRQKENQEDLLQRVNQATLDMLNKGGGGAGSSGGQGRRITDIVAYKSPSDMQHNNSLTVQVDHRSECVLVPIYGMLVPFHILTVKNASNNQDGEHAYIRLNFNFGGSYEPGLKHPRSIFLKELSFRSADVRHAAKVVQEIKALRSAVQQREKEKAERATLVQQEKLVRGKGRVYALPDVWIRPAFGGKGRKVTGTLEAHANGFRYSSPKGEELDIMYRNIKHAFFQPADSEMIALVHFHLVNPIMVGKKKTNDVQFYTEVMDSVQTLDAGRRSMYDPDEIEEEQRERERRNQINRQFNQFVKRVQQDIWERDYGDLNLEFEVPFRELGFHGVPHRTNSFIMPTVNCLVELTEMPFTVLTLSEVNLVNLERVGFNLRNFDMVFIWKDLNRDVGRIDSIPSTSLDTIKDWLTSIEIKYYESKVNLNWKNILKSIKEDPEGFIEDGGWSFLDAEQSDSDAEDGEEESDFAPSEAEDQSDEDMSSEDESLASEGEEESEYEAESDEEEGLDWDELEEQARADDRERDFSDEGEEEYARKRKAKGSSGGAGKKARR